VPLSDRETKAYTVKQFTQTRKNSMAQSSITLCWEQKVCEQRQSTWAAKQSGRTNFLTRAQHRILKFDREPDRKRMNGLFAQSNVNEIW